MHRFAGRRADEWARVVRAFAQGRQRTLRLVVIGLMMLYVGWLAFGYRYHFIDGVNLLVHEAGHLLFTPFGETWHFLGGTLLQIAVPIAFCVHFMRRGERFAGALMALWVAESLMYTGRYLGDAVAQQLPLVGGGIHDWGWLLAKAGLLRHAEALGFTVHVFASCLGVGAVTFAWQQRFHAPAEVGAVSASRPTAADPPTEPEGQPLYSALGSAWLRPDADDEIPHTPQRARRHRRVLV